MFLILVLALVVVGLAVAGLLSAGLLATGRLHAALPLFVGVVALVVVVGAGVLLVGRGAPPEETRAAPVTTARPATPGRVPRRTALPAEVEPVVVDIPRIALRAAPADGFSTYQLVGGLLPVGVVRVRVDGFESFERGSVQQCVLELGRLTSCGPSSPVQFDEQGNADFQVLVHDTISVGGCRVGRPTCLLRVTGAAVGRHADAQTVFVDRVAPGRVTVEPADGLADGDTVEVVVEGFPPNVATTVVLCAPPDAYDARRCDPPPGAPATFTTDAGGTGHVRLTVGPARLGNDGVACGPRRPCGVAVVVGPGFVAAPAVPISFSLGPGASYEPGRLATGLGAAAVLLLVATVLGRRTDWTKPGEAATPSVDAADLQLGATLDDLFGTDAELDERDPVSW